MKRSEMINTIGNKYIVSNTEQEEFSYPRAFKEAHKSEPEWVKNNKGRTYQKLDIRFVDKEKKVAVLVETKENFDKDKDVEEQLAAYVSYEKKLSNNKIIAILANTSDNRIKVWKGIPSEDTLLKNEFVLKDMEFYSRIFTEEKIDKQHIYDLTKKINDCLHTEFGIKNLYHRMIFTACALVAKRYGAFLVKGMDYSLLHNSILNTLNKSLADSKRQNQKLGLLVEVYSEIKMNSTENQEAINNFIEWTIDISDSINSDNWNGEDVMGIFFNEFNRYKKKSESGQVFTPDHITSLIYRILEVNQDDYILDAACGSGAFLVKSMCNMIKEAGGMSTLKSKEIKENQLFGIEFDREIYALACANMLIHKDGKTNLEQMDSRTEIAGNWIKSKPITKVLMNPPFENKYGCMTIVENVLNNVKTGTKCAFILPDKKLEKVKSAKKLLDNHTLKKIIKLPENLFFNIGVTTSVFVFEAGIPQNNKSIFGCHISDDGLETVKNQGRQDVKDKWKELEDYWVDVIYKQSGDSSIQWIDPSKYLSYQMPEKEFEIFEEDFVKTVLDYMLFENKIDVKEFNENLLNRVLYSSEITYNNGNIIITLKGEIQNE